MNYYKIIFFAITAIFVFGFKTAIGADNQLPIGFLDGANCNGFAGWTCDADDYSKPLSVAFYATSQSGVAYCGSTTANTARTGLEPYCGNTSNRGFIYALPDSLKDGQPHGIYAYAINTPDGTNPQLSGSPKVIQCACSPGRFGVGRRRFKMRRGPELYDRHLRCGEKREP